MKLKLSSKNVHKMKKEAKILVIISFLTFAFYSCSYDSESDLITPIEEPINNGEIVNYVDNVQPILASSCISCHASPPVNGAPFSLINYDQVSQRANNVLNAMSRQNGASGAMPPAGRLPQTTIDIIQQWINDGLSEN